MRIIKEIKDCRENSICYIIIVTLLICMKGYSAFSDDRLRMVKLEEYQYIILLEIGKNKIY